MKKKKVVVSKSLDYARLKCLIMASYLLGQQMGLKQYSPTHPECVRQRNNLTKFLMDGTV